MGASKSGPDTLLRQWHLLRAIPRCPTKIAAAALRERLRADGLDVTVRTIQRDLLELSETFPLEADDRERPFGWRWMKDAPVFNLPNLSNQEALAFAMVEDTLGPLLPQTLLSHLEPYFSLASKRLASEAPKRGSRGWLGKVAVIQPTQPLLPPRIDPAVHATVTDALLLDRQVRIRYWRRGDSGPHEYVLTPLGLVQRGPVTYIVGTLLKYEDVRTFALHRIQRATMLDAPARRPEGFSLDAFLATGGLHFGAGKRLRLHLVFDAAAAEHLHETPLAADQELTPIDAEHVRLRATVIDTPQLRWWLLAFGDQVEVKAPAALRAAMAATASAMARRYREKP